MTYNVKLDNFEGPLDLLLFLVRKNEIDIQNIPIVKITQQYMEYIELMNALNLDIAGEFLVMAATLLYLKSRALIPRSEEEESEDENSTLEALKKQLLEYQQYKDAALHLKEQNILEKDVFTRSSFSELVTAEDQQEFQEASLFDLIAALKKVFERTGAKTDVLEVTVEHLSVKDKINEIMQFLQECKNRIEFSSLFSLHPQRIEVITTFLALLELIKLQAVKIYQNANFSTIYIYSVSDDEISAGEVLEKQL